MLIDFLKWLFLPKQLVGVYPEFRAVRAYSHDERSDDGPILGYEIRYVTIYKRSK